MTSDEGADPAPAGSTTTHPHHPSAGVRHGWRSMGGVLAVQTQNAFNDHLVKMFIIFLAREVAQDAFGKSIAEVLTLIILGSFIVFSPLAGFLADRYSKRSVIKACLLAQVGIFAIIAAGIHFHHLATVVGGFVLLAVQSVFFSPGKFGIPKELVGSKGVGLAASLLQMLTMLAILAGMWISGPWFDSLHGPGTSPWRAALIPILVVGGLSLIPPLLLLIVRPVPAAHPGKPFRPSIIFSQLHDLAVLLKPRNLRLAGLGVAFFWGLSAFVGVAVVDIGYSPDSSSMGGSATETSLLSVSLGLGVLAGSLITSFISRRGIELGIVPIGGIGIFIGLLWTGLASPDSIGLFFALGFIGMSGAMFMIPLNAYLQDRANPKNRGQVMAAANLLDCLSGTVFTGIYIALKALDFDPQTQFLILATPALLIALFVFRVLPQNVVRFVVLMVVRRIYRVEPIHHDRIPESGGVLMVANHMTYLDAFVISAACDRPVRFVIFDYYYNVWWMRWFFKLLGSVPISSTKAKSAIRTTADAIKKGEIVCIFPEGQISRTGMPNEIKNGFALIARNARCPVVPAFMDSLWGSIFSFESAKYIKKRPLKFPYTISVCFGHPIDPKSANADDLSSTLGDLAEEAFRARPEFRDGLPRAITRALARKGRKPAVIDARIQSRTTKRRSVLAVARRLANAWENEFKNGERVGVLLPNSGAATMIHSGLVLSGAVPVNLPLDTGSDPDALRDAIDSAGIKTVITAKTFRDSIKNYPWPDHVREVGPEIKRAASGLFFESLKLTFLPTAFLLPKKVADPHAEAAAWIAHEKSANTPASGPESGGPFTFHSITHSALVANAHQLANINLFRRSDRILACTDAASFAGVVCGLWHPILQRLPAVNLPLAAQAETLHLFAGAGGATVAIAGSLPQAQAIQSATQNHPSENTPLRNTFLVAPLGSRESIATREMADLGIYPLGTLTDPPALAAVSLPHPDIESETAEHQDGWIENSPGRIFPGIAFRRAEEGTPEIKGAALGSDSWVALDQDFAQDENGFLTDKLAKEG